MAASLELLQGADEYFPALIQAIESSESSVYLESYLIHDDPPTQQVLEALIQARQRGVQVHVLLDGYGAGAHADWARSRLEPHGIHVEFYRPGVRWLAPRTWRRLHRKLAVIDEQCGFVGGINLIGDRFDLGHRQIPQPRFDFAVVSRSSRVVAAISGTMRRLWWRVQLRNDLRRGLLGRLLQANQRRAELVRIRETWRRTRRHLRQRGLRPVKNATHRVRLLLRDNLRHRRSIERWYLWKIRLAQHQILIANAYFLPTFRFRQALMQAARRGVRVRLLIQGNVDQWWTHWASQALVDELTDANIEIYRYTPSFLHAKVAVIDEAMTVGSSNIDPFSLMMSLEANLVAEDPGAVALLRSRLEHAIEHFSVLQSAVVARRGPFRSLARRAALTLALMLLRMFVAVSGTGFRVR